jgi:hypothetical protein
MKKYTIQLLFTAVLFVLPYQTTNAGIIDVIRDAGKKVKKAADAARLASSIAAISGYPSQYVRAANAIIDDMNDIKRLCAQSNLAKADQVYVLDMTAGFLDALATSLDEFCDIVDLVSSFELIESGDVDLDQRIADARKRHNENMQALYSTRRTVAQLRALLLATHAGNSLMEQMKTARKNGY